MQRIRGGVKERGEDLGKEGDWGKGEERGMRRVG